MKSWTHDKPTPKPKKKRAMPTCTKCHRQHWSFRSCEEVKAEIDAHTAKADREKLVVIMDPSRRGLRPWGDRLHTLERSGDSLMQKRTVAVSRNPGLVYPKEDRWQPPRKN